MDPDFFDEKDWLITWMEESPDNEEPEIPEPVVDDIDLDYADEEEIIR